ncbi:putative Delta(7)-sterol 5(6)-desaturase [Nymphaea thermarum]|nr:putative Delta(7)-sterol 5(6)-desaturase [Nymphaea thermarum]
MDETSLGQFVRQNKLINEVILGVLLPAGGSIPKKSTMLKQIWLSVKATPLFSLLPTATEYMIEKGWTMCFANIEEVGWPIYIFYTLVYVILVEFGTYWAHRELHDIKPLYKYVHAAHHKYNKEDDLSPFAGYSSNPIDGIIQGSPLLVALFLVPVHFPTYLVLAFRLGVWTTNIHDCIHRKVWPIMGAGCHKIHHTSYRHNEKLAVWYSVQYTISYGS